METPSQSLKTTVLLNVLFGFTLVTICSVVFSVAVSSIAMGISIALLFAYVFISKEVPKTTLEFFFLAYAIGELLASIFSAEPVHSFINMKRLLLISIVYLVVMSFTTTKRVLLAVTVFVVFSSTLSFVELFSLTTVEGYILRLSIFQYFLTESGLKMMTLLLIVPFLFGTSVPRKWRIGAAVAAIPLIAGLILTQTRSSWLGFLAGVVALGMMKYWKALLAVGVLLVAFMVFAPDSLQQRATSIFNPSHTSNRSRINMVMTGWKMFLDRPLFGFGDVDLKKYYVTYTTPIDAAEGGHLHNNIMHLLVTLGSIGFAAAMAMFGKIFLQLFQSASQKNEDWLFGGIAMGCFAAYIGFHVNGFFEWNFGDHEVAVLLWFIVGLSLVVSRLSVEPKTEIIG